MKRFILRLLLAYTVISVIAVVSVICISRHNQRENRAPRKTLYVVNMTGDSISVHISGAYTKEEKRAMKDKPDEYVFDETERTMPYHWKEGGERQAVRFRIPHKYNTEIELPDNFMLHIKSAENEVIINKEQFESMITKRYNQNWWVIYVNPHWFEPEPEPEMEVIDTTIFTVNGIRYRYLPEPGEVEVTYDKSHRDSVFIPETVDHNGKIYRVTAIGDYVFTGNLLAFTYSNAIRHIGKGAFMQSSSLRRVAFPDSLLSIGEDAFSQCVNMESFTFPETLESIGRGAFAYCWGITSVIIPPRVSVIRDRTFCGCRGIERLTIPQAVTSIEAFAFAECSWLKQVKVNWQTPIELPEEESPFQGVDLSCVTLIVPAGTKLLYQSAPIWKEFGKIEASQRTLNPRKGIHKQHHRLKN